jgi:uncharacterized protein
MRLRFNRSLLIALAAAGCMLRPLPPPQHACADAATLPAVWSCLDSVPRTTRVESGFRSTTRIATDFRIRSRNQSPVSACSTRVPPGFRHVSEEVVDAARLDAFYKAPDPGRPTVIVVHGIFDSRANRFMRVAARRLADSGYGVLVPDMRWHGCLFTDDLPSTLGILEAGDLRRWSAWLRERGATDVGLLGFSLGALDVIHAVSACAPDDFRAGAIAVAPPAHLERVLAGLDSPPRFSLIHKVMRRYLATRLRGAEIAWKDGALFDAYLQNLAGRNLVGATTAEILQRAEPLPKVPEIAIPTLVLVAENDPLFGALVSDAWASSATDNVHVIETRTGGHIGQIGEQPQWFSSLITSFYDAVCRLPR